MVDYDTNPNFYLKNYNKKYNKIIKYLIYFNNTNISITR